MTARRPYPGQACPATLRLRTVSVVIAMMRLSGSKLQSPLRLPRPCYTGTTARKWLSSNHFVILCLGGATEHEGKLFGYRPS